MAAAAPQLRVIEGGREPRVAVATAPDLHGVPAADRIPSPRSGFSSLQIFAAVLLSLAVHAGIVWWGLQHRASEEARAAGGANDPIVIEGESVILVDSMPSDASAGLPEATSVTGTQVAVAAPVEAARVSTETKPAALDVEARPALADTRTITAEVDAAPAVTDAVAAKVAGDRPATDTVADDAAAGADAAATAVEDSIAVAPLPEPKTETRADVPPIPAPPPSAAIVADAPPWVTGDVSLAPEAATSAVAAEARPAPAADAKPTPIAEETTPPKPSADKPAAAATDVKVAIAEDVTATAVEARPTPVEDEKPTPIAEEAAPPKPAKPAPTKPVTKTKPAASSQQQAASVANEAARGPAAGTAGAGGASTEERGRADSSAYQAKLAAHLRRFRTFPPEARDKGITGTAIVRFTVNSGGSVTAASLARTSGAGILDQAAVAMVRRASPFPPIPAGMGASLTVNVPVRFDLR
jgi:protein TonB